ncbi:uncharacterized protein LOC119739649 [Patiria miniata]|uniref:UPAR/Ly6 domain-containing protein n=1 Tax=Patiria miniata TaxID=46514 RepID=A0A914B521_PATMI|nr:uncharacterized protein LOC119739649 [Patiria miniata]
MKLLQIALMCGLIGGIVGLQCFFCTDGLGDTSVACRDPFNTSTTDPTVIRQLCGVGAYSCSKSYLSSADMSFTVRGCVDSSLCPATDGCTSSEYQGNAATGCCCTTDFCNGAGSMSMNLLTTAAVGLAALFALY